MNEQNYNNDIEIDPNALDIEWCRQARLFMSYAEQAAKARDKVSRLKERRDVAMADLGLKIRKAPLSYGVEKVTEGTIQSLILTNSEYQKVTAELADAEYELDILSSAVRALDQKKSALENLVRLQGQSYFAGPTVPRDISVEWAKDVERRGARESVKRKLNR